jgi:putative hydrolase of the HAD superfamily
VSAVRVVSYDFWATLARGNSAHLRSRVELLATAFGGVPFEAARNALRSVDAELDRRTEITGEQYGFAARVDAIGAALGADPLDEARLRVLEDGFHSAFLSHPPSLTDPSLPTVLAKLADGGRSIAVTSNTGFITGRLLRVALRHLGLAPFVDRTVFSDEVGHAKPAREIYAHLSASSGRPGAEILHVGDNRYTDYDGARAAGLHALWYRPAGEPGPDILLRHEDLLDHPLLT